MSEVMQVPQQNEAELIKQLHLQLMVVVVDRSKGQKLLTVMQEQHSHLHFACLAEGTANSHILDLLGLGSTEKMVSMSIMPHTMARRMMHRVNMQMDLAHPGHGIAFTMPLLGVSGAVMRIMDKDLQGHLQDAVEKEVEQMQEEMKYDLILSVIKHGCSEELMTEARKVGATGGTVLHARRIGAEDSVKFFGISIQSEKELVAILIPREKKHDLMRVLVENCGIKSPVKGIFVALPVDEVAGLPIYGTEIEQRGGCTN